MHTNPINNLLREVETFQQTVATEKPSKQYVQTFITRVNEQTSALEKQIGSHRFTTTEQNAASKLTQAVATLGNTPIIANQLGKSGTNVGNVLLALSDTLDKLREKPKERIFPKKVGYRIEKYEVAQFLNSTEKELERFITVIKMEEADEDVLFGIIIDILRRMELLKTMKHSLTGHKIISEVDPVFYKRILKVLQEFNKEKMQKRIHEIGEVGEYNMHKRLFSLLKSFQKLVSSCIKS